MRIVLGLMTVLTISACIEQATCDLEQVIDSRLGGPADQDCGSHPFDAPEEALRAAHDCVARTSATADSLVVLWDLQGIDSRVRRGLARPRGDNAPVLSF